MSFKPSSTEFVQAEMERYCMQMQFIHGENIRGPAKAFGMGPGRSKVEMTHVTNDHCMLLLIIFFLFSTKSKNFKSL